MIWFSYRNEYHFVIVILSKYSCFWKSYNSHFEDTCRPFDEGPGFPRCRGGPQRGVLRDLEGSQDLSQHPGTSAWWHDGRGTGSRINSVRSLISCQSNAALVKHTAVTYPEHCCDQINGMYSNLGHCQDANSVANCGIEGCRYELESNDDKFVIDNFCF